MPLSPPASTVTTTSVVEFHANVPSASGRSVGMRYALALRPEIGAPAASLIFVVASGQDGAQHLPGRIPDDASLARVTFNERLGEVQRLLERDVRRQRRYLGIGFDLQDHWALARQ